MVPNLLLLILFPLLELLPNCWATNLVKTGTSVSSTSEFLNVGIVPGTDFIVPIHRVSTKTLSTIGLGHMLP